MKTNPCPTPSTSACDAEAAIRPRMGRQAQTRLCSRMILFAAALAAASLTAPAQDGGPPLAGSTATATVALTNAPGVPEPSPTPAPANPDRAAEVSTNELASAGGNGSNTNGLRLNFRNAPIDLVLNYLSDAAGFIIEMDSPVKGNVSVISSHPMTRDEAVDLVNSVLNKNGYAAIRSGERTLKIMDKSTAKSSGNPVKISNDPATIPDNDEMVTQIIPIRFVEASQLVSDLSPFVSSGATIIANQAGNSIVITDTQANIKHLVEIIKAIDSSAEDVTVLRVFHLDHADPTETATLLTSLFPDQNNSAQSPMRFAGGRGGGRGGGGGAGFGGGPGAFFAAMAANAAGSGNSQSERIKKRTQVVAVADPRTSSVVVTATKDLMEQIADINRELDFKSDKETTVKVFKLNNADAQEILPVLQNMFQNNTTASRSGAGSSTQTSPFQTRLQQYQNSSSSSSTLGTGTGAGLGNSRGGGGGTGGF